MKRFWRISGFIVGYAIFSCLILVPISNLKLSDTFNQIIMWVLLFAPLWVTLCVPKFRARMVLPEPNYPKKSESTLPLNNVEVQTDEKLALTKNTNAVTNEKIDDWPTQIRDLAYFILLLAQGGIAIVLTKIIGFRGWLEIFSTLVLALTINYFNQKYLYREESIFGPKKNIAPEQNQRTSEKIN